MKFAKEHRSGPVKLKNFLRITNSVEILDVLLENKEKHAALGGGDAVEQRFRVLRDSLDKLFDILLVVLFVHHGLLLAARLRRRRRQFQHLRKIAS